MKKIIYILIASFTLFLLLGKIGVYDASKVKIDNFIIEKPFLYRNVNIKNEITLGNKDFKSFSFLHSFMNGGSVYSFKKIIDKNRFKFESNYSLQLKYFDISNCYIEEENIFKNSDKYEVDIKNIYIYSYPYILSFIEINVERENRTIKQVCEKKKIIKHAKR